MFDTLSLEYFAVVARERSLNRAARLLHASQPAVSRRIQQLETEAGVPLLKRHSSGVVLTSAGRTLARYADEICRLNDEARHLMQSRSCGAKKAMRVGFYQPATSVVIQLIRDLQAGHPEIEVEPIEDSRAGVLEALRQGKIDIAFPGYVHATVLGEFEGVRVPGPIWNYILPDAHPLAHRKRLRLAELKNETFVSLDEREFPGFGCMLLEACRLAGFVPQVSVYAHSLERGDRARDGRARNHHCAPFGDCHSPGGGDHYDPRRTEPGMVCALEWAKWKSATAAVHPTAARCTATEPEFHRAGASATRIIAADHRGKTINQEPPVHSLRPTTPGSTGEGKTRVESAGNIGQKESFSETCPGDLSGAHSPATSI